MNHYGIRGVANQWIRSYLTGRTQYCTYEGKQSTKTRVTCGVPQGSIIGPFIFLIYINDLDTIFNKFRTILFADDSNLITTGTTLHSIEHQINREIPTLVDWLYTNRLSLNLKKTHYIIFGPKRKKMIAKT
jgi:hypothetical protein